MCVSVYVFCSFMAKQFEEGYCAALIDKVERLKSIEEPKIVLIGDSNWAFGMDSAQLEENMQMPVVDMGLHGGIGNIFHENMAKLYVTPGDVYVYSPDTFADDNRIDDTVLAWTAIGNRLELFRLVPKQDVWRMIKRYPTFLKKCIERFVEGTGALDKGQIYSRDNMNEYGDILYKNPEYRWDFDEPVIPPQINDVTIERINGLSGWLQERGATLVIAAYPIGDGELTADKEEFVRFQKELEQKLDCEVISDYTDYMYDYDYFYDSPLHLTAEGTDLRTKQLIIDLKNSSLWKK